MYNFEQLYTKLSENKGLTLTFQGKEKITNLGYQVGVFPIMETPWAEFTLHKFNMFVGIFINDLDNQKFMYDLGFWIDDDGVLFIDYSEQVYDFHEAREYGRGNKQKAIYSWATGESIDI